MDSELWERVANAKLNSSTNTTKKELELFRQAATVAAILTDKGREAFMFFSVGAGLSPRQKLSVLQFIEAALDCRILL